MHDGLKSGLLTHRRDELRLASLHLFNARRLGPTTGKCVVRFINWTLGGGAASLAIRSSSHGRTGI